MECPLSVLNNNFRPHVSFTGLNAGLHSKTGSLMLTALHTLPHFLCLWASLKEGLETDLSHSLVPMQALSLSLLLTVLIHSHLRPLQL